MANHEEHLEIHQKYVEQYPEVLEGKISKGLEAVTPAEKIFQYGIEGITEYDWYEIPDHLREEAIRAIDYIVSWMETQ